MRSFWTLLVANWALVAIALTLTNTVAEMAFCFMAGLICIVGALVILGVEDLLKNTKGEDK